MISKTFYLIIFITVLSSCSSKPKIESIKLAKGSVESTVTTINSGTVEAKSQAELAFGTVGRISKIYVTLGSKVNEGALIAELENADLKAIYDEAQKDLSRTDELYKNGLVSIANLDSAKRAREVARINFEKTIIKAPFTGMITAMNLRVGEFFQSAAGLDRKSVVQIIDLKKRIIKGEIDEVDLQKVSIGFPARVKIPALKNQIFNATVTKVVPYVSTAKDQDRTSQIELEVTDQNNNILIPVGASADVEIISETKQNVAILPSNVLYGAGKTRIAYKVINGKLVKSEVKIGLSNYERSEILEGIGPQDLIAKSSGTVELADGMKVEAIETKWP